MAAPKAFLKKHRKKRLEQGHPWVFPGEIDKIEGDPQAGDIIEVFNHEGHFLAQGFFNPESQLIIRVLTYSAAEVNEGLFLEKIKQAWKRRERLIPDATSCRVVHGEADFLPGLIIDKYEDVFVVQILSLGVEVRRQWVYNAITRLFKPRGIYERSDVPVRKLEGLPEREGFVEQPFDTKVTVIENGLRILVDVAEGQKTGYFFDQRENRAALKPFMTGWGADRFLSMLQEA